MIAELAPHWKGHILWFEPAELEPYPPASGTRLLLIVLLLEGVLGPRMGLLPLLGINAPPAWLRVPLLLVVALVLIRWFAGVKPAQLGLRGWTMWSKTEKSYFVQVFVLANVIFASIYAKPLAAVVARKLWAPAALVFVTSILWGLYQELIYRGMLQTELSRRWGSVVGILVANTLYTFGPLHFYHFASGRSSAVVFGGTFAIGLFFSLLFRRSHNLWMVGLFHGLGDWYIVGVRSLLG